MSRLMRFAKALRPVVVQQQAMVMMRPTVMRLSLTNILLTKSFGSDAHGGKDEVNQDQLCCCNFMCRRVDVK